MAELPFQHRLITQSSGAYAAGKKNPGREPWPGIANIDSVWEGVKNREENAIDSQEFRRLR